MIYTNKHPRVFTRTSIHWLTVLLCIAAIFLLSHQQGSQSQHISEGIINEVQQHLAVPSNVQKEASVHKMDYNYIFRKAMHFIEYFILALLLYTALRYSGRSRIKCLVFTLLFCIIFAISDELHQCFIPGRSPRIKDVFIDTSGAALALALTYFSRIALRRIGTTQ